MIDEYKSDLPSKIMGKYPGLEDIDEWIDIHANSTCLDGSFTADQLRRIANAMDKLKETTMHALRTELEAIGMFKFAVDDPENPTLVCIGFKCEDEANRDLVISKIRDTFEVEPQNPVGEVDSTGYVSLICYGKEESEKIMEPLGFSSDPNYYRPTSL